MSQRNKKNRQKRTNQNRQESRTSKSSSRKNQNPFEEYGVEFDYVSFDPSDEKYKEYNKVEGNKAANLFSFFQYIPGMAAGETIRRTAEGETKRMLDGAYKVLIKDGMHLAKSKATEGAFRGTLLSDANNVIAGQAEMLPIEQIKLSRTPQLALSAFNAISIATGQYFLSQINSKLGSIEQHVSAVLSFLEEDKKSQQRASALTLQRYYSNMASLKNAQILRQAALNDIQAMRRESLANCFFYNSSIRKIRETVGNKSKEQEIEKAIRDIARLFPEYWLAVFNFIQASLLELLISEMDDPDYIASACKDQLKRFGEYNKEFEQCESELTKLLENAEALKLKLADLIPGAVISAASAFVPRYGKIIAPVASVATAGIGVADYEKKETKKKELTDKVQLFAEACGNTGPMVELITETIEMRAFQVAPLEMYITDSAVYFDSKIDELVAEKNEKKEEEPENHEEA